MKKIYQLIKYQCKSFRVYGIIIVIILLLPFLLKLLINHQYLLFFESWEDYYGSLLGAVITFSGVLLTLRHSDKQSNREYKNKIYLNQLNVLESIRNSSYRVINVCNRISMRSKSLRFLIKQSGYKDEDLVDPIKGVIRDVSRLFNLAGRLKSIYFPLIRDNIPISLNYRWIIYYSDCFNRFLDTCINMQDLYKDNNIKSIEYLYEMCDNTTKIVITLTKTNDILSKRMNNYKSKIIE